MGWGFPLSVDVDSRRGILQRGMGMDTWPWRGGEGGEAACVVLCCASGGGRHSILRAGSEGNGRFGRGGSCDACGGGRL
jgi:hypothetical protein